MKLVQPIRNKEQIVGMMKILKSENLRDYTIFLLGLNTGIRISDILNLRIKDITEDGYKPKYRVEILQTKTDKTAVFKLNDTAMMAITNYFKDHSNRRSPFDYAFKGNRDCSLSRQYYWTVLKRVGSQVGVRDNIGCHTMRKSFGYHAYREGTDITMLQEVFGHSAPSITKAYIGITQDEIDEVYIRTEFKGV